MKNAKNNYSENDLPLEVKKKLARLAAFTELNPRPVIEIDFKGNVLDQNYSARVFFPDLKKRGAQHPYLSNLKEVISFFKKDGKPFRRKIQVGENSKKMKFTFLFFKICKNGLNRFFIMCPITSSSISTRPI